MGPELARRRPGLLPRTVRGRTTAVLASLTVIALSVSAAVLLFIMHAGLVGSAQKSGNIPHRFDVS